MVEIKQPDSAAFIATAKKVFLFLLDNGFSKSEADITNTTLTVGLVFRGQNVAVSLALDRRDGWIGCYLTRVLEGQLAGNDVNGGYWGDLHSFLVKHRGYRGTFKEFRFEMEGEELFVTELKTYAKAIQQLAPDIVMDSGKVFQT